MAARRVIVTRPAQESARWVDAFCAAGIDAVALPLIRIEAVADTAALQQARLRMKGFDALMFVSATAASRFLEGVEPSQPGPRFWSTGPGTARALQQAGVLAAAIDSPPEAAGQFDSEALWALVHAQVQRGTRVLVVRGGDATGQASGRDWLAREIVAAGGTVDTVVAYRRLAPSLDVVQRQWAAEGAMGRALWLFSSSEAIGNLCVALPELRWEQARAVVTHARIAEAARRAGFGDVHLGGPGLSDLVASIESLG